MTKPTELPLKGIRVVDAATILAGPVAATMLGDFGAEVIKVEMPRVGDILRGRSDVVEERSNAVPNGSGGEQMSLWFLQEARNKRSVTLDLHKEKGQELLRRLAEKSDVLIENFRPGTFERWNLAPALLLEINPRLVILRVTGYGQTGPYREKGAFDRTATAFGGGTYVTGFEDGPPVRTGFAVADYMGAFAGAFAVMTALYWRDLRGGRGQVIDLALYEPILRASEASVPEYDRTRTVRQRAGNKNPGVVPTGNFLAADGKWVVVAASTDRLWRRLAAAMGRPELGTDERFVSLEARLRNEKETYSVVEEWVATIPSHEVVSRLDAAMVPADRINSVADLFDDPHIAARKNIVRVPDPRMGELAISGVVPKFSLTPGRIAHLGPDLGEANQEIYGKLLGLSSEEIAQLAAEGVI